MTLVDGQLRRFRLFGQGQSGLHVHARLELVVRNPLNLDGDRVQTAPAGLPKSSLITGRGKNTTRRAKQPDVPIDGRTEIKLRTELRKPLGEIEVAGRSGWLFQELRDIYGDHG